MGWWGSCRTSRVEEYEEDEDAEDDGDAQGVDSDRAPQVHPWQPEFLFHRIKQRLCNCHGSIFSSALFNCQRTITSLNHLFLQPYTWFVPEPRTWHLSQLGVAFDQVAVGLSLAKCVNTPEPLLNTNRMLCSHSHTQIQARIHAHTHTHNYIFRNFWLWQFCAITLCLLSGCNSNGYNIQFPILDSVCSEKTNISSETSDDGCQSVKASVLSAVCVVSSTPDLCRPMTCQYWETDQWKGREDQLTYHMLAHLIKRVTST